MTLFTSNSTWPFFLLSTHNDPYLYYVFVLLHFRFTALSFADSCKSYGCFKLCSPAPLLQLLAQPAKLSSGQDSKLAFMYHGTSAISSNSDSALLVDLSSVKVCVLHALCKILLACCWSLGISAAWHALTNTAWECTETRFTLSLHLQLCILEPGFRTQSL